MAQTYELKFLGKHHLTADIWEFHWQKPAGFSHQAGQYLYYTLPHANADDRGIKRWFTISASPTQPDIMITTRIFEKMSSFKHALNSLEPGQTIQAEGPEGDFVLPHDKTTPAVLIAGGIGVTPYHAQIHELLDQSADRPLYLLYGAKQPADFVYREVFERAARQMPQFTLEMIVDKPAADWDGPTGHITDEQVAAAIKKLGQPQVFVSGPEPMVDAFEARLQQLGVAKDHIKQDWFPGYVDRF